MGRLSGMGSNVHDNLAELKARSGKDPIAVFLGMKLEELSSGYARVSMQLKPDYLNFNGLVFGGIIVALADQAFAYASNTLAYPSYACQFNIHFIAGPAEDDELMAECSVVKNGRKVGLSEMTVTNQDGKLIAKADGNTIPAE